MIEQLRTQYKEVRDSLPALSRQRWNLLESKLAGLETPPTPEEWVNQLLKFKVQCDFEVAKERWISLRRDNELSVNISTQVEGWDDNLPMTKKTTLLVDAFYSDLDTIMSYEDWLHDRDW
jgi:hypothetical protein